VQNLGWNGNCQKQIADDGVQQMDSVTGSSAFCPSCLMSANCLVIVDYVMQTWAIRIATFVGLHLCLWKNAGCQNANAIAEFLSPT